MAFGLGFILGPYIGGKLADSNLVSWFSYDTPFLFAALLSAINIGLVIINFNASGVFDFTGLPAGLYSVHAFNYSNDDLATI